MASSHVLKKLMRSPLLTTIPFCQSPSSKLFNGTGFQFHTSAETSTSSHRSPVAVRTSLLRFINKKDFNVHISDEDYGKVIKEKKDPKGARVLEPYPTIIHNGECLSMFIYMPVMKSNHLNVTVEDNMLLCKGTRPDGKPAADVPHYTPNYAFPMIDGKQRVGGYVANYIPVSLLPKKPYTYVALEVLYQQHYGTYACGIELPNKTYTPGDVEAKMKDRVLLVTFNNVTEEDVAPFI